MKASLLTLWLGSLAACAVLLHPLEDGPFGADADPTEADLLATVVARSLRLAEEEDPLRRADHCNEVADHFAEAVAVASAQGDAARAERLGTHLSHLLHRGVAGNVKQLEPEKLDSRRLAQWRGVQARAHLIGTTLEKGLAKCRLPLLPAFRHFQEHTRKHYEWWAKSSLARGKPKGVGKPWGLPSIWDWRAGKSRGKPFLFGGPRMGPPGKPAWPWAPFRPGDMGKSRKAEKGRRP